MPSTLLFTLADTGPWVILRSNAEKYQKCADFYFLRFFIILQRI